MASGEKKSVPDAQQPDESKAVASKKNAAKKPESGAKEEPSSGQAPLSPEEQAAKQAAVIAARRRQAQAQRSFEGRSQQRFNTGTIKRQSVKQQTRLRWPQFVFLGVLLAIVVLAGLFTWDRWFRYDDIEDFRGEWVLAGTTNPVAIDASEIGLAEDVKYSYKLDTWAKTITYTFGDLKGSGIYRFSPDRTKLMIIEGGEDDWWRDAQVSLGLLPLGEGADPKKTTSLTKPSGSAQGLNSAGAATPEETQPSGSPETSEGEVAPVEGSGEAEGSGDASESEGSDELAGEDPGEAEGENG